MVREGRLPLLAFLGKYPLLVGDPETGERQAGALQSNEGGPPRLHPGEIARFLDVAIDEAKFSAIVEHCTFDYMKAHAELAAPVGGIFWEGGAKTFIHKGTNGRWRDTLTPEESKAYEAKALAALGPECARWLAGGG